MPGADAASLPHRASIDYLALLLGQVSDGVGGILATDLAPLHSLPAAHRGERRLQAQRSNELEGSPGTAAAPEALRHRDGSGAASRLGTI